MTTWRSRLLDEDHDTADFDCGVSVLNEWLVGQALRAQRSDTARTYVWTRRGERRVVGYYSITPTQVKREDVASGMSGGVTTVPAYLLARLALDRSLHEQGLGSELLVDALDVTVRAAETAAGRLVVVDAINDAAHAFYRHHDFQPIKGSSNRLVLKVATARKALGS